MERSHIIKLCARRSVLSWMLVCLETAVFLIGDERGDVTWFSVGMRMGLIIAKLTGVGMGL
jgi:hypothetical protein